MILIDIPTSIPDPDAGAQVAESQGPPSKSPLVTVVGLDPLPPPPLASTPDGDVEAPSTESVGDAATRALLFGRYEGQIRSRIERAWVRPRTAIGDKSFSCNVKVLQDKRGFVKEVELITCNGTPRWQLSLAAAIQSASPLPAPPNPDVYADALTLTFQASAYVEGDGEQGYEPETAVLSAATSPTKNDAASTPATSVVSYGRNEKTGVIDLRITGARAVWTQGRSVSDGPAEPQSLAVQGDDSVALPSTTPASL